MGNTNKNQRPISQSNRLGDFILNPYRFPHLNKALQPLKTKAYHTLNHQEKWERVSHTLFDLISTAPDGFLLIAIIEYLSKIDRDHILSDYTLTSFELWLNQFSQLSDEENYRLRAKIVGKHLPRDAYQTLFPIGMGKTHPGSHYVTAHAAPDLDTTVASFWGWIDAFGARVAEGLHLWNVPEGPPEASIEILLLFHQIFGQRLFHYVAKTHTTLTLSSLELMTQRGVVKQTTDQSSMAIDHERTQKAIILVDPQGAFLGDWRSFDVEGVRQVIMLFNHCLRWFENHLHISLISLFSQATLAKDHISHFCTSVFSIAIAHCQPARDFTDKQKRYVERYLQKVLYVKEGLAATFSDLAHGIEHVGLTHLQQCIDHFFALTDSELFDKQGQLIENRPPIFTHLKQIIAQLDQAIQSIRLYTERLDVALNIKTHVFGYLPQVVNDRADVEELKTKMGNYTYLTVTSSHQQGNAVPLGVIRARDLQQPILGTVTLRDFCNRDETKIPSYLEVISVIDHHKALLNTSSAPVAYITDTQSSNSVVAQLAIAINTTYSTAGMSSKQIDSQIARLQSTTNHPSKRRLLQRLLAKQHAADAATANAYFVDPLREFIEYLHFLYAILDDTDLLTKVSKRDVEVVAELLNRLKTLMTGEETEVISFDDIPPGSTFTERAATRILQHPDMYSIYRKVYTAKEQLVEENLQLCADGKESSIFLDTKLQNGCVRIGQTKLFTNNFPSFNNYASRLRESWALYSHQFFNDRREFDLHLQMISTIANAEDLYSGTQHPYTHNDELWMWIPMTDQSIEHLKGLLMKLKEAPHIQSMQKQISFTSIGPEAEYMRTLIDASFLKAPHTVGKELCNYTMTIMHYPAAALNSRKAMISPYLPKQVI